MTRALLLLLLLAGCVGPVRREPPPRQVPLPSVAPPLPPPPPVAWEDRTRTPGEWRYGRTDTGSIAIFGRDNDQLAALACVTATRRMSLSVTTSVAVPRLRVDTTTVSRELPVAGGTAQALLAATDPLLDAMIYSRGRIRLSWGMSGGELIVPASPEINRVVEDCRG